MKLVELKEVTNNLDSRRIPLNSMERSQKESNPIYPYIGANNIMAYIDEYIFEEKILCIAEDGGSWGKNETCAKIYNEKVWVNNHAHVVTSRDNLVLEYLMYYLNYADLNLYINGATRGKLTKSSLNSIQIPLPPLEDQKKIAAILDAADVYRQKTKALIAKYDELTQSLFLDMFGDPVKNEKRWEKEELKKIGKVITGSTPPSSKENMFGGNIPFVTPGDLDKYQPYKRFVTEEGALNSRTVNKGSLFVCCIGATIGKTGIARELSSFNQQINAVAWSKFINSQFGYNCFFYLKNELIKKAISTTLPIMKKSEFEKLKMIVPPIDLQNQFAEHVKAIETQKVQAQGSLVKAEELFNSLLQRAFKGELV
jgi:type I restriction enzyme S subunit